MMYSFILLASLVSLSSSLLNSRGTCCVQRIQTSVSTKGLFPKNSYVCRKSEKNTSLRSQSLPTPKLDNAPKSPRLTYLAVWLGLLIYAFKIGPQGDPEVANKLINDAILHPYDGTLNPIFVAIFNLLGVYPAIYGSLLLPGSKSSNQKLPGSPFVLSSFALGFFGIGPFLAFREPSVSGLKSDASIGNVLFESKISSALCIIFTTFLIYYALFGQLSGGADKISDFITLFKTQQLVHVSTIDFTILTLAVWEPMREDMVRRRWEGPSAVILALVPVFGPLYYLLTRPPLKE